MGRQLDTVCYSPVYLRQPAIAELIVHSIYNGNNSGNTDSVLMR